MLTAFLFSDAEPLGYSITWAVVSALWFLIVFLSVLPLFVLHTVLLWRDQTTDEFLKNIRRSTERKSCGEQCHSILFAPIPPRWVAFCTALMDCEN